jgi:NDP-sugar pyrophosphorylase family protein
MIKKDLIILAAGKGSRLTPLTDDKPKCLVKVNGKSIMHHILDNLPTENINNIIVVVGYMSEKIIEDLEENYESADSPLGKKLNIKYVMQGEVSGTYGALLSAKNNITTSDFIVMNADDIYSRDDMLKISLQEKSFGVTKHILLSNAYSIIEVSKENKVTGLRRPTEEEMMVEQYMATGLYILDKKFWELIPVHVKNSEEYSLPKTLMQLVGDDSLTALELNSWTPINTILELQKAEIKLKGFSN